MCTVLRADRPDHRYLYPLRVYIVARHGYKCRSCIEKLAVNSVEYMKHFIFRLKNEFSLFLQALSLRILFARFSCFA